MTTRRHREETKPGVGCQRHSEILTSRPKGLPVCIVVLTDPLTRNWEVHSSQTCFSGPRQLLDRSSDVPHWKLGTGNVAFRFELHRINKPLEKDVLSNNRHI